MQLEQRRQAVLQLNLSDQRFIAYGGASYIRGLTVRSPPFSSPTFKNSILNLGHAWLTTSQKKPWYVIFINTPNIGEIL